MAQPLGNSPIKLRNKERNISFNVADFGMDDDDWLDQEDFSDLDAPPSKRSRLSRDEVSSPFERDSDSDDGRAGTTASGEEPDHRDEAQRSCLRQMATADAVMDPDVLQVWISRHCGTQAVM